MTMGRPSRSIKFFKTSYSLQRNFRDIASDVWIAEQQTETEYRTTEIFFSRHVFNFYVEELNIVQEVPLGLKTYSAPNVCIVLNIFQRTLYHANFFCRKTQPLMTKL